MMSDPSPRPYHSLRGALAVGGFITAYLVIAFLILLTRAEAHNASSGWSYPVRCCWGPADGRTGDCGQIPTEAVKAGPDGYVVSLAPGDHPMVKAPITFVVPYADVEPAPDGLYHVCFNSQMKPRCFFAGGRAAR